MVNRTTTNATTQNFLDIYDITNDLVIMKDGSVSIILTVSAMNFGLLAEEEQDAIIYAYAALLNSLNYTIQILIQSQTKDATTYLNLLKEQEQKASTTQKRELISRYRTFVSELIKERNVLDKKFYVIVPAAALELGFITPQSVVPGAAKFDITNIERSLLLEKATTALEPKRDHLIGQFNRIGLYARQLKTQEIIQVFYNNYNPEASEGQQITNSNDYTTPLVQASITGGLMDQSQNPATAPAADASKPATPAAAPADASATSAPAATPAAGTDKSAASTTPDVSEPVASIKKPGDAPTVGTDKPATSTPATPPAAAPAVAEDIQKQVNESLKDVPAGAATPTTLATPVAPAAGSDKPTTDAATGKNPTEAIPQLPEI